MSSGYSFDQLKITEEVEAWSVFCASCFAYKANPPPSSYFLRHFLNDPNALPEHIFVARCEKSNEISASVRVFIKELAFNVDVGVNGDDDDDFAKENFEKKVFHS